MKKVIFALILIAIGIGLIIWGYGPVGEYSNSNPNHARQIVNRYPQGREVTVYFKPGQPEISVLEPGDSWSTYMPLGMGVVFFFMGFIIFFSKNSRIHLPYR